MVNRDRHDIIVEILQKAVPGKTKTELMRDVGLSYLQTKQYFGTLQKNELLEIDERGHFKTTRKGTAFLDKCLDCTMFKWNCQRGKKPHRQTT